MNPSPLTPRHLQIPARLAAELASRGAWDPEEIESECWYAMGKACVSFDPGKLPGRQGQNPDKPLGIYIVLCCRRAITTHVRQKERASRRPSRPFTKLTDAVGADHRTGRRLDPPQLEDARATLEVVLRHLEPRDQQVLRWHAEGLDIAAMARKLRLTKEAVRQRLRRIQARARRLRDEGVV
jgi:RNA polymerase sigma factor (sigma-70 family)